MPVLFPYILKTENQVLDTLKRLKAQGKTLRTIAADYEGISYGDIHRALKGQFPKSAHKRAALNLPALALHPVCRDCGQVHTAKRCPLKNKRKPNPFKGYVLLIPRKEKENR